MATPEPAPEPVGFGIVGAGAIVGLSHGPAMARLAEARLVAVSDKDAARAEANGRAWGAERWYAETEALIADAAVEAVLVATPNRFHRAAVEMAAAAGKPVFCEKPLAATLTDARAMVEACAAARVILQVGFNQRFWAQVRIAKQLIDTGFIGRVHGCRSLFAEQQGKYPAATAYRYDLAQSGGATIIDLTVHRIDLVRHLLGEFRSLTAEVRHNALAEAVDDNVWILANLQNGATVCLTSDRYGPGVKDETDIFGSEGTIHFATETLNPFHAAPLAVHTERAAADLPDVLRQAHYPGAWWRNSPAAGSRSTRRARTPTTTSSARSAPPCATARRRRSPARTVPRRRRSSPPPTSPSTNAAGSTCRCPPVPTPRRRLTEAECPGLEPGPRAFPVLFGSGPLPHPATHSIRSRG